MKLALTLPGTDNKVGLPDLGSQGKLDPNKFPDLASFISPFLNIIFYIAVFLAFYFLVWGAFAYLMAQGKKEDLAKARARISWALVGLLVVFTAFFIAKFGSEIFRPSKGGLPFQH